MRKKALRLRAKIHVTARDGTKQPAVEPAEVLLMMETLSRWVSFDHRHKTFLSYELIIIAARIIGLRAMALPGANPMHPTQWKMPSDWSERAFLMGIDIRTMRVIDEKRFKWLWYQLGETGKFSPKLQKELINSGKEPPEIEPLIITKPYWSPRVKTEKLHTEAVTKYQNEVRKEEIMGHFFV